MKAVIYDCRAPSLYEIEFLPEDNKERVMSNHVNHIIIKIPPEAGRHDSDKREAIE